jgi:hypothetical protein
VIEAPLEFDFAGPTDGVHAAVAESFVCSLHSDRPGEVVHIAGASEDLFRTADLGNQIAYWALG